MHIMIVPHTGILVFSLMICTAKPHTIKERCCRFKTSPPASLSIKPPSHRIGSYFLCHGERRCWLAHQTTIPPFPTPFSFVINDVKQRLQPKPINYKKICLSSGFLLFVLFQRNNLTVIKSVCVCAFVEMLEED